MDPSLILPYLWVILVLVFLEGLLAADNAVVMAVMVKHLPPEQRKKALFYGLLAVSYTHLTLPTIAAECRSRWSPYH